MYPQNYGVTASAPVMPQHGSNEGNAFQSASSSNEDRMRKFQYLVGRYEINQQFAARLRALEGYEIVLILDDSGSMNTPIGEVNGPFDKNPTRWDELRQTASIVVDIASVFDPDGIDVFFLNREPLRNVKNSDLLNVVFAVPPSGPTPILRVFRRVLEEKRLEIQERKLLVLIATDGVPTDENGRQDVKALENSLKYDRNPINRILVTIIACTDDLDCVGYLNKWDKNIPNLDVADDYRSEREEILKVQGRNFPFSFGDYVVKILMGSVDEWFDTLDERRVDSSGPSRRDSRRKKSGCSIV